MLEPRGPLPAASVKVGPMEPDGPLPLCDGAGQLRVGDAVRLPMGGWGPCGLGWGDVDGDEGAKLLVSARPGDWPLLAWAGLESVDGSASLSVTADRKVAACLNPSMASLAREGWDRSSLFGDASGCLPPGESPHCICRCGSERSDAGPADGWRKVDENVILLGDTASLPAEMVPLAPILAESALASCCICSHNVWAGLRAVSKPVWTAGCPSPGNSASC